MAPLPPPRLASVALLFWVLVGCSPSSSENVATSVTSPQIILDCDPAGMIATGFDVDDDLAILAALSLNQTNHQQTLIPLVHIIGLTITAGNTQLSQGHADAVELVRHRSGISREQLPIFKGARWWPPPWERQAGKNHDGFGGMTEASRFIIDTVMSSPPRSVTVLCLGPLTNIAAAMHQEPRLANRLQALVMMGGIIKPNRKLDFNFRFDRSAASFVMKMPVPKLLIPVETAVQAVFGSAQLDRVENECKTLAQNIIEGQSNEASLVVCSLLLRLSIQRRIMPWFVNPQYNDILPHSEHYNDGFILWDVVALFALVHPEIFNEWHRYEVSFSTEKDRGSKREAALKMNLIAKAEEGSSSNRCGINQLSTMTPLCWADYGGQFDREIESNRATIPLQLNESAVIEHLMKHLLKPPKHIGDSSCPIESVGGVDEPRITFWLSLGLLPHLILGLSLLIFSFFCSYALASMLVMKYKASFYKLLRTRASLNL